MCHDVAVVNKPTLTKELRHLFTPSIIFFCGLEFSNWHYNAYGLKRMN